MNYGYTNIPGNSRMAIYKMIHHLSKLLHLFNTEKYQFLKIYLCKITQ